MSSEILMGAAQDVRTEVATLRNDVDDLGDQVQGLEAKHPADPTTDGTYVLKCTVASGVVTYSWVVEA